MYSVASATGLVGAVGRVGGGRSVSLLVGGTNINFCTLRRRLGPMGVSRVIEAGLRTPVVVAGLLLHSLGGGGKAVVGVSSVATRGAGPRNYTCNTAGTKLADFSRDLFRRTEGCNIHIIGLRPSVASAGLCEGTSFAISRGRTTEVRPGRITSTILCVLKRERNLIVASVAVEPRFREVTEGWEICVLGDVGYRSGS